MHTAPVVAPDLSVVLDRIRGWAAANDWKPATFAKRAGVAETVTRDMEDPAWGPSSNSIRKLEALIPDGWMPGHPVPPDLQAVQSEGRAA